MIRATSVAQTCAELARTGYRPDFIIGHNGWGELLNLKDIWPKAILDGYFEFFYKLEGADVGFDAEFPLPEHDRSRVRARNAVNLLGLEVCDRGHTPTRWQHSTYPGWSRRKIRVTPEGVDLSRCRPNPSAIFQLPGTQHMLKANDQPVVTFVARNLEPYRGFHVFMRSLPSLLRNNRALQVVVVGGEGVSYGQPPPAGSWRDYMLAELDGQFEKERVHFVGKLTYHDYITLLQVSWVHVYLTYPFVASWSLREALATGCCVVGSDTEPVREFIASNENGVLVPFFDSEGLAETVSELLCHPARRRALSQEAARRAETFGLPACLENFVRNLCRG